MNIYIAAGGTRGACCLRHAGVYTIYIYMYICIYVCVCVCVFMYIYIYEYINK